MKPYYARNRLLFLLEHVDMKKAYEQAAWFEDMLKNEKEVKS